MKRIHQKQQAIELRLQGKSYNEIRKTLGIPSKGTLSYWFRNFKLPEYAKNKLRINIQKAYKCGLLQFNKIRSERILRENKKIFKESQKVVSSLSKRDLLLVGIALYWGEGCKKFGYSSLSLTNTDPRLIKLYMHFLRKNLRVPDQRIRTHIHIHPNMNVKNAIEFWSKVTMLPMENFRIVNQISRSSKGKRPKNLLPYGTLDVRVHSRKLHFMVLGLIDGLAKQA